jgi:hypothetical protein
MSNCKVTAICNQKGGVTKTTTTANLGVGLAMQGKKVLLVDSDPQADLTTALGWPNQDTLPMAHTGGRLSPFSFCAGRRKTLTGSKSPCVLASLFDLFNRTFAVHAGLW